MQSASQPDKLRRLTDSARTHGLSRNTLNELLRTGEIGYVRLPGGERRIPDSAVREWVARRIVRGSADAA